MITVFIPVYNREAYIAETIRSALNQTYQDFELLIINDGSTDSTVEVINQFSDSRIRLLHNSTNLGLPETRNRGIEEASGKLIAFLDSDDIMLPNRLEKQFEFLKNNTDIVGIGTQCNFIDEHGSTIGKGRNYPTTPEDLKIGLLFYCSIMNGTFLGKTDILKSYSYDPYFTVCEDYDLFSRISSDHILSNLEQTLTNVRKHDQRTSSGNKNMGEKLRLKIAKNLLSSLDIQPGDSDLAWHRKLHKPKGNALSDPRFYLWAERWLLTLLQSNEELRIYDRSAFNSNISNIWINLCKKYIKHHTIISLPKIVTSPLSKRYVSNILSNPRFAL